MRSPRPSGPCDHGHVPEEQTQLVPLEQVPWQALLDSAGEGIWGVDLDGICTFVNRAALAMLGFTAEELVGQNMHQMIHHHRTDGSPYPDDECVVYNVFWKQQTVANYTDHLFRKDGKLLWIEMSAQPIIDRSRAGSEQVCGAVVTFRDVGQTRLAESALRRSEKLAAVGQLASSIAHEINNPLESVTNLLYLMRTAETLENVRMFAAMAETELARVSDITIQTLRFHRQQSSAAPVDLSDLLPSVLRLYTSRFQTRKIEVRPRLRPVPLALIFEGEVRQVLNNLVRNAYDVMLRGGVLHLRVRPAASLLTGAPGVRVTIADTGDGILPRMRANLFEPFHTSKDATGTGLGLWISRGIMEKHGGSIRLRSRHVSACIHDDQPSGTVFALWFPLAPSAGRP